MSRKVRYFIGSATSDVFGVTLEVGYLDKVREATFAGELVLFDREGFLIPVYRASNVLEAGDGIFQYRGDDRWAIGHVISTRADDQTLTQILSIVPVADPQRAVLRLILGPPLYEWTGCEGFYWSWRARDTDGDGTPEVEIGPNTDTSGGIEPRAVFRWSQAANRYIGPDVSPLDGYMRLDNVTNEKGVKDDCCGSLASKEFAKSFPASQAPYNNFGVRRPLCDPPQVSEMITIH